MKNNRVAESDLFSAVLHEIRNSLNPVINLAGVLKRNTSGKLNPDESSYLEVIERNGRNILNVVEELSFLNKLPDRVLNRHSSHVAVREVIDNASAAVSGSNNGYRIFCDDENSSVIFTDYEVFLRIIENICRFYALSGGGGEPVCFSISISEREFHLVSSHKKEDFAGEYAREFDKNKLIDEGFGGAPVMWLQFASMYAGSLNGLLSCSHCNGGDIIIFLTIPLERDEVESEIENHPANDIEDVHAGDPAGEFTMLVIDDDIDNFIPVRAIIENEFKGSGKVYYAGNADSGLDLIGKVGPDIILLDLTLSDTNGFSLVRNIKNLFVKENVPVIAFTALDVAGNKEKMLRSGFDDVIRKPFSIDTFTQTINRWLR